MRHAGTRIYRLFPAVLGLDDLYAVSATIIRPTSVTVVLENSVPWIEVICKEQTVRLNASSGGSSFTDSVLLLVRTVATRIIITITIAGISTKLILLVWLLKGVTEKPNLFEALSCLQCPGQHMVTS